MKLRPDHASITLQSVTGQALALVPLVVGVLFGALALPRSVPPEEIPAPRIDERQLARVEVDDDARAARVAATPLESPVRRVGSAFRGFNAAEANRSDVDSLAKAHRAIVDAVREVSDAERQELLDLRAYQMLAFLGAVRRYERTGEVSDELRELGGTFVDRMIAVGWCERHSVAMPDAVRRAAFKLTWNHTLIQDSVPGFALTLDETRALYGFYLSHPHAGPTDRQRVMASMRGASDALARERAADASEKASATWLLAKIHELAAIDPTYPEGPARAAALYRKKDYRGSAVLYQAWLEAHPSGPWTLRVQNHLRAALVGASEAIQ